VRDGHVQCNRHNGTWAEPPEQQRRRRCADELSEKEPGDVTGTDAGEGVGGRAGQSHCGVREGRRRREPVGAGDVGGDRERNRPGTGPGDAPDDAQETERGDRLAQDLGRSRSTVGRHREGRELEHPVGESDAEKRPDDLSQEVSRHRSPWQAPPARIGDGDGGVEVSARDGTEGEDQRDECPTRRDGIREQRQAGVPARQSLGHDPAAHHRHQEERRSGALRHDPAGEGELLSRHPELAACAPVPGAQQAIASGFSAAPRFSP